MRKISLLTALLFLLLSPGAGPIGILSGSYGVKVLAQGAELPASGLTPDSPFYFLEIISEGIGTFFTFGDLKKAERYVILATERVAEVKAVAEKGKPEAVQTALKRYEDQLNRSLARAEKAKAKGISIEKVTEIVAETTGKHLLVLEEILEKVPEEAREAIAKAKEASINSQKNGLRFLASENPERATEINLKAAEARLNRAKVKAEENDIEETENAIKEFENLSKFGEEISEIAKGLGKDITTLEQLVGKATAIHLEGLAEVYEKVSEQAKPAIEKAMEVSVKGHRRAVEVIKEALKETPKALEEALKEIPKEPPIPERIPEEVREKILKPEISPLPLEKTKDKPFAEVKSTEEKIPAKKLKINVVFPISYPKVKTEVNGEIYEEELVPPRTQEMFNKKLKLVTDSILAEIEKQIEEKAKAAGKDFKGAEIQIIVLDEQGFIDMYTNDNKGVEGEEKARQDAESEYNKENQRALTYTNTQMNKSPEPLIKIVFFADKFAGLSNPAMLDLIVHEFVHAKGFILWREGLIKDNDPLMDHDSKEFKAEEKRLRGLVKE